METKICTKCGIEKPLEDFSLMKLGKGGRRPSCKECQRKANRAAYIKTNPDAKELSRGGTAKTRSQIQADYERRNPEYKKAKCRKARERLAGNYVRELLVCQLGIDRSLIPGDVVEMKRQQILIFRDTRKLINAIKEKQNEH